jgi:hypothetical protein
LIPAIGISLGPYDYQVSVHLKHGGEWEVEFETPGINAPCIEWLEERHNVKKEVNQVTSKRRTLDLQHQLNLAADRVKPKIPPREFAEFGAAFGDHPAVCAAVLLGSESQESRRCARIQERGGRFQGDGVGADSLRTPDFAP